MGLTNRDIPFLAWAFVKFLCRTVVQGFLALLALFVIVALVITVLLSLDNIINLVL